MALAALWVTGLLAYQMPGPGWLANGVAVLWLLVALWASWRVARGRGVAWAWRSAPRWRWPACGGCC
jgi:hypothetical protein